MKIKNLRIVVFVGATHGEVDEGEEGIGDGIGQWVKGVLKLPRPATQISHRTPLYQKV